VEGLVALYEGKLEEALDKARQASAAAPWLYEAKKLEGDALFARGSRFGPDAAFDYDRMIVDFEAAAAAYANAADIARSDPRVHEAECRLWAQVMNAAPVHRESLRASHDRAKAACERAIAASSRNNRGHLELAVVQFTYAWLVASGMVPTASDGSRGTDRSSPVEPKANPETELKEAVALAEDAVQRSPQDPMAPYVLAEARRSEAQYVTDRGLDARAEVDGAIASYEEAIARDPTFLWAVNGLAYAWSLKAGIEIDRGLDPEPSLEASLAQSRRALEIDPGFLRAYGHESIAYLLRAEHLVDTGHDPAPAIAPWRSAVVAATALSPSWPWSAYHAAYQSWLEARYALDSGKDAATLQKAGERLEEGSRMAAVALGTSPSEVSFDIVAGHIATTRADVALQTGEDPTAALKEARACFERAVAEGPWDLSLRVFLSRVEIVALRSAEKRGRIAPELFRAARAPLEPLLAEPRVDPRLYETLAEIDAIEATWLIAGGKAATEALNAGLGMTSKALALNPRSSRALATETTLVQLQARAPGSPARRAVTSP
jgi:serine/threonine-protein kinase